MLLRSKRYFSSSVMGISSTCVLLDDAAVLGNWARRLRGQGLYDDDEDDGGLAGDDATITAGLMEERF